MTKKPKLWWVMNRFHNGGAELGLEHLMQNGFFEKFDLEIIALCEGDKTFRHRLEDQGAQIKTFRDKFTLDILTWAMSPLWLVKNIAQHKPDLIVLSLPQANISSRLAVAMNKLCRAHKPYVISFEHNTILAKPIYETLFKCLRTQIDAIFSDCQETADVVKHKFSYSSDLKTYIVPLYSCRDITPPAQDLCTEQPLKILSAGRLTTVKNHITQLEAVKVLRDRGISAHLTIYGEGSQRAPLEDYIKEHKLEKSVSLPGFIRDWTSEKADIYLMTSKHEGLCIVILEAMQKGLPVIAYPTGGVKNYGQETVYFIEKHCPHDVADQVEAIINQPNIAYEKVIAQQLKLKNMFGKDNVIQTLSQISQDIRATL